MGSCGSVRAMGEPVVVILLVLEFARGPSGSNDDGSLSPLLAEAASDAVTCKAGEQTSSSAVASV